ncbi:2-oxo-4-hydroxy-4-carboxy-5-ureidoimidazoline decarboxylase [Marinomonas sp. IMCC 4694]|uniref:2-oxo-4-hydroxy-4-carboxy-5-ureidoimidazoline decarboxylase n=1 Tax=Marinomonas sp. IMCC 4694 TaxID=2605432 RepID=UPI0011E72BEF|nr:2-oxo-4-hydroxy-4-carboxy-5-ureidoimidazoline decarboxylase [Marinomonas sp. IMCC 4694]TYL47608.1 2-oxo-4-hydroxy-4-carboxy-5-ureidoimidazoline decarboxylase [Marinomonas sp. IMCC 4694]
MHDPLATLDNLNKADFISLFSGIYEHSDWVADALWHQKVQHPSGYFHDITSIKIVMANIVENSTDEQKLLLLRAHPDLAGKAALAGELTHASTNEQAGAGLDHCSEEELAHFLQLNNRYHEKFGFPFIMAVKGATKAQILAGFEARTPNDCQTEFDRAMSEVHKIAGFRLADL